MYGAAEVSAASVTLGYRSALGAMVMSGAVTVDSPNTRAPCCSGYHHRRFKHIEGGGWGEVLFEKGGSHRVGWKLVCHLRFSTVPKVRVSTKVMCNRRILAAFAERRTNKPELTALLISLSLCYYFLNFLTVLLSTPEVSTTLVRISLPPSTNRRITTVCALAYH